MLDDVDDPHWFCHTLLLQVVDEHASCTVCVSYFDVWFKFIFL